MDTASFRIRSRDLHYLNGFTAYCGVCTSWDVPCTPYRLLLQRYTSTTRKWQLVGKARVIRVVESAHDTLEPGGDIEATARPFGRGRGVLGRRQLHRRKRNPGPSHQSLATVRPVCSQALQADEGVHPGSRGELEGLRVAVEGLGAWWESHDPRGMHFGLCADLLL